MIHRLLNFKSTNISTVSTIGLLTVLIVTVIIHPRSYAGNTKFSCDSKKSIPVTVVRRENGTKVAMIRWVKSKAFAGTLTPLQRCKQVAERFQRNYDNGTLRTIITGKLNGQPVVCAAYSTNDVCTHSTLLFTLQRGSNARLAVERLLDQRALAAGKIQNQTSDDTQIYIDFDTYVNYAQVEP